MGHLHHGTRKGFDKTSAEWLKVGSQINELVNKWSGRSDIVTYVGEDAGAGHPACFYPGPAEMEVNAPVVFDSIPAEFIPDLRIRSNQFDYPVVMGAVMHESFHAKHSKLSLLEDIAEEKETFVKKLATAFEETRIESRGVEAIPKNKSFLRACALKLVMGDIEEDGDFASRGIQSFSHLMLLTLARVDAGVLKRKDVKVIQDAAEKLFDKKVLNKLRLIWLKAQAHDIDSDGKPLLRLARDWVKVLEDAGHDPKSEDGGEVPDWLKELLQAVAGSGGDSGEGSDEGGSGESILVKMSEDAETDARSDGNEQASQEIRDEVAKTRAEAANEAKDHKKASESVFGRGTGPGGGSTGSRLIQKRPPTAEERTAAVSLSKALEKARYRDRVSVRRSSVIPPGKLNSRRAIAASEQKSRGVDVTSEAWNRVQRKHTDDPTLTVGVLVDISGSMSYAMEPMASAAWILSEATRRVQGRCAMVYYGDSVFPVLKAGEHLKEVNVYSAPDGTEKFDKAFKALNGSLNLLGGTGARVLVVVSDIYYSGYERTATEKWMKRCQEAGVAVIIAPFGYDSSAAEVAEKLRGVELLDSAKTSGSIVRAAQAIGAAAVRQLEVVSS